MIFSPPATGAGRAGLKDGAGGLPWALGVEAPSSALQLENHQKPEQKTPVGLAVPPSESGLRKGLGRPMAHRAKKWVTQPQRLARIVPVSAGASLPGRGLPFPLAVSTGSRKPVEQPIQRAHAPEGSFCSSRALLPTASLGEGTGEGPPGHPGHAEVCVFLPSVSRGRRVTARVLDLHSTWTRPGPGAPVLPTAARPGLGPWAAISRALARDGRTKPLQTLKFLPPFSFVWISCLLQWTLVATFITNNSDRPALSPGGFMEKAWFPGPVSGRHPVLSLPLPGVQGHPPTSEGRGGSEHPT